MLQDQTPDVHDGAAGADRADVPGKGEGGEGEVRHENRDLRALRTD